MPDAPASPTTRFEFIEAHLCALCLLSCDDPQRHRPEGGKRGPGWLLDLPGAPAALSLPPHAFQHGLGQGRLALLGVALRLLVEVAGEAQRDAHGLVVLGRVLGGGGPWSSPSSQGLLLDATTSLVRLLVSCKNITVMQGRVSTRERWGFVTHCYCNGYLHRVNRGYCTLLTMCNNRADTVGHPQSAVQSAALKPSLQVQEYGKSDTVITTMWHGGWVGCERGPFGLFSQPPAEPDWILVASSGSPVSLFL
jgi:hypothetical protein